MTPPAAIRRALAWHEDRALLAFAPTAVGRVAVWAATAVLLPPSLRLPVLPLLAIFQFFPEKRIPLLAVGSLWVLFFRLPRPVRQLGLLRALPGMLLVLAILAAVFLAARHFRRLPAAIRRYPNVVLHALFWGAVAAAYASRRALGFRPGSAAWILASTAATLLPFLVWRCGYTVLAGKRGTAEQSRFRDHLSYWLPVWGGTATPIGKGYDYLRQNRADVAAEIAASQLAGVKLLVLSWIWFAVRLFLAAAVFGEPVPRMAFLGGTRLAVPHLEDAIAQGGAFSLPLATRWACIFLELVDGTLGLAVWGHRLVGVIRLFGFRVFRNTYKPLVATSLVDFWGRYYYYFKELLVEFFFFPVFVKHFKTRPRLRIFAATMAAATIGNLYYHVMRDFSLTLIVPAPVAASRIGSRLFYCTALGLGIFVSMLREKDRRGKPAPPPGAGTTLRRVRAIAGVWLFFSLLHVWSVEPVTLGFQQRGRFFLSLFAP